MDQYQRRRQPRPGPRRDRHPQRSHQRPGTVCRHLSQHHPLRTQIRRAESPLELWIENSTVCSVASDVRGWRTIQQVPERQPVEPPRGGTGDRHQRKGARTVARNAGFEERHCGLHLGLGGGQKGSHHLDLIFASGALALDDKPVFDGNLRSESDPQVSVGGARYFTSGVNGISKCRSQKKTPTLRVGVLLCSDLHHCGFLRPKPGR